MRPPALLALVLGAGLLVGCSGGDEATLTGAPPTTSASAVPAPPAGSTAPPPAASLSGEQQTQALQRIYDRLDPAGQEQFCAQSDRVGPAALAEQLTQQGASRLDADLLEQFLVDTCGAG